MQECDFLYSPLRLHVEAFASMQAQKSAIRSPSMSTSSMSPREKLRPIIALQLSRRSGVLAVYIIKNNHLFA